VAIFSISPGRFTPGRTPGKATDGVVPGDAPAGTGLDLPLGAPPRKAAPACVDGGGSAPGDSLADRGPRGARGATVDEGRCRCSTASGSDIPSSAVFIRLSVWRNSAKPAVKSSRHQVQVRMLSITPGRPGYRRGETCSASGSGGAPLTRSMNTSSRSGLPSDVSGAASRARTMRRTRSRSMPRLSSALFRAASTHSPRSVLTDASRSAVSSAMSRRRSQSGM
jgi:hypothetical protein